MNDLDPLLREAMARVHRPIDARPSFSDVRRRARRRNRRRMSVTAGVVACAGVATTALIVRRDTDAVRPLADAGDSSASTTYMPDVDGTTTSIFGQSMTTVGSRLVWDALAAVGIAPTDDAAAATMPTAEQFGCNSEECQAFFTYVVWHEIARALGFGDLFSMQEVNPGVDFTIPPVQGDVLQTPSSLVAPTNLPATTTTGPNGERTLVVLIDDRAPEGATDHARQRLTAFGFDISIVTPANSTYGHSAVIPITEMSPAYELTPILGITAVSSLDESLLSQVPSDAIAAVVIGPDYWEFASGSPTPTAPTTTMIYITELPDISTTTIVGP